MATSGLSSRRNFVMGSAAAVALTGPLAVAAKAGTRGEIVEWERLTGANFVIASESGKAIARLAGVEGLAADSHRPRQLARSQPFFAYFELAPGVAPAGQKTYRVVHPTKGVIDLFLSRGTDRRGKAVAMALFN